MYISNGSLITVLVSLNGEGLSISLFPILTEIDPVYIILNLYIPVKLGLNEPVIEYTFGINVRLTDCKYLED